MANSINNARILVLVPSLYSFGGISNYFQVLHSYFTLPVDYFTRGVRHQHSSISRLFYPIMQLGDYLYFIIKLKTGKYSLVHLNTSFGWTGLIRDYFYILIIRSFKIPYIVFFRGIDEKIVLQFEKQSLKWFQSSFLLADKILVLSHELLITLTKMHPQCKVALESTVVDEKLIDNWHENDITAKIGSKILLFMARLEKTKGIYETIAAFKNLQNKYPDAQLFICGVGKEFDKVNSLIGNNPKIKLYGYVRGKEKQKLLSSAGIYLFPSYYEGMPNSVLEAMALGLPIITTPVGGLVDFFINGQMGLFIEKKNVQDLTEKIIYLFENQALALEMGLNNYQFAKKHFYSSVVAARIESYYQEIIREH